MSNIPRRASQPAEQTRQYRYSIGTNAGLHRDDIPYTTDEEEYDDSYPPPSPRSAIRYQTQQQVYTQGNKRLVVHNTPPHRPKQKPYWIVFVLTGMFLMAGAFFGLTAIGSWWKTYQDDLHYGRPRTFQTDVLVDAPTPSHFLAMNTNGHIEVVEFIGGDATKAKVYIGPTLYGPDNTLDPVTVTFSDVNGDGKADMILHVLDQSIVFINTGSGFTPKK